MAIDLTKMMECGKRIYNSQMTEEKDENGKVKYSDEEAIKALCSKIFTKNGEVKSIEDLRSFNSLIVSTGDEMAKAKLQPILDKIANYKEVGRYDNMIYEVPKKARIHTALSATGTGVNFTRIAPSMKNTPAIAEQHQFGAQYNIERMISDPVNEFRNAVDYVMDAEVKYIFAKVMSLARTGKTLGKIPEGQEVSSSNITIEQFRGVENKLLRYGNRVTPILIADVNLIDSLAMKQTGFITGVQPSEKLVDELLREISISKICRSIAIPTDNPFTDDINSKVDLPVNEGIMIAGGSKSPFYITKFGSLRTVNGVPDIEDEIVRMKIDFKLNVTLLYGQAMAYLKDDAVVL